MAKRPGSTSPPAARKRQGGSESHLSVASGSSTPSNRDTRTHELISTSSSATMSPTPRTESAFTRLNSINKRHTKSTTPYLHSPKLASDNMSAVNGDLDVDHLEKDAARKTADHTLVGRPRDSSTAVDASNSLVLYNTADEFPHFRNGNVVITTTSKVFRLHGMILAHHSPWFANSLQEMNPEDPQPSCYSYTIKESNGSVKLVRQLLGEFESIEEPNLEATPDVQIKVEDYGDYAVPLGLNSAATVESYAQILGSFYNIQPQISKTDIMEALCQAEGLTEVAEELGCLQLIRPFVCNAFGQYRQKLFVTIKSDPARWINLAIKLEDTSIYTECLIHLVGAHPNWPWRSKTKKTELSPELHELITKKSQALDQLCLEADRDLLMITVQVGRGHAPISSEDRSQIETWMLVQLFRDTFAGELHSMDCNKKQRQIQKRDDKRGAFYRKILRGGSAYMEYEDVRERCMDIMDGEWRDLGEDLKLLKEYASKIVEELGDNELMIDPDAHGIGYLTCVKVQADDIPWVCGP